jgi:23S rRNA (cytidine1920-2'-O)/16S rRNA (cytidine1409-2'-O)-methyltransferase
MKAKSAKKRLDSILVERRLADSVQRAQAMILAGEVQADGVRAKAGALVPCDARIEVSSRIEKYASRGGFKLERALADFAVDPSGFTCLDVGASTGGFCDCLLQHGAARVYALDVNVSQLDWKLREDHRVVPVECNARRLRREDIREPLDLVTVDVSFISATKVLAPVAACAKPAAHFLILVKPQFELPSKNVGRGGVVKDEALHQKAVADVTAAARRAGLDILAVRPSRVLGAEGNQEYFLHARKNPME